MSISTSVSTRLRSALLFLLCVSFGFSSLVCLPAIAQEVPPEIQKAMDRERKKTPKKPTAIRSTAFTASASATLTQKPVALDEISWHFVLGIGSEVPISCTAYAESMNLAALLKINNDHVLTQLEEKYQGFAGIEVDRIDVEVHERTEIFTLDWLYVSSPEGGSLAGSFKQKTAYLEGGVLYCNHIEMGYKRTFDEIFRQLAASLDFTDLQETPGFYEHTYLIEVDGFTIGFENTTFRQVQEDLIEATLISALFAPNGTSLVVNDRTNLEYTRLDGELLEKFVYVVGDGRAMDLSVEKGEQPQQWLMSGAVDGEEISATLTSTKPLYNEVFQTRALERLSSVSETGQESFSAWIPDESLDGFVSGSLELTAGESTRNGKLSVGSILLDLDLQEGATTPSVLRTPTMTIRLADRKGQPRP